jgi:hypothetical protein
MRRVPILQLVATAVGSVWTSNGCNLGVIMEPLWSTRCVRAQLQRQQRALRPPQSKELVAQNMAMAIFAKIGADQRPMTEILGIGRGQASGVQHSAVTTGISTASGIQDSSGAVAMDTSDAAGTIDITAASRVQYSAGAAAIDTAAAGAHDNTGIKRETGSAHVAGGEMQCKTFANVATACSLPST